MIAAPPGASTVRGGPLIRGGSQSAAEAETDPASFLSDSPSDDHTAASHFVARLNAPRTLPSSLISPERQAHDVPVARESLHPVHELEHEIESTPIFSPDVFRRGGIANAFFQVEAGAFIDYVDDDPLRIGVGVHVYGLVRVGQIAVKDGIGECLGQSDRDVERALPVGIRQFSALPLHQCHDALNESHVAGNARLQRQAEMHVG